MIFFDKLVLSFATVSLFIALAVEGTCEEGRSGQKIFESEEQALQEMKSAFKAEDADRLIEIFGKPAEKIFKTGDPVGDKVAMRRVSQRLDQRAELLAVDSENYQNEQWYLIRFGIEGWNMHIPLVNRGKGWNFASEYASNADEKIRRSLNEVATVDTLQALVKAQATYESQDRNGDGVREYAQKFLSSPGKKDGLYWPSTDDASSSPIDGIIARAVQDGYKLTGKNTPYGGYVYKLLPAQGGKTRGGKKSFLKDGRLIDGYAILAYPVEYKVSGDATFLVAKDGQVWKRDLGSQTDSVAPKIQSMELSSLWYRANPHLGGKNTRSNW